MQPAIGLDQTDVSFADRFGQGAAKHRHEQARAPVYVEIAGVGAGLAVFEDVLPPGVFTAGDAQGKRAGKAY